MSKKTKERRVIKMRELEHLRSYLFSLDVLNTTFILKKANQGKDVECPLYRIYNVKVHPRLHAYFKHLLRKHNLDFDAYFSWCIRHACNLIPHILVGDYFMEQRWTKGKRYGIPILPIYDDIQEPDEQEASVKRNKYFINNAKLRKYHARKHSSSVPRK